MSRLKFYGRIKNSRKIIYYCDNNNNNNNNNIELLNNSIEYNISVIVNRMFSNKRFQ